MATNLMPTHKWIYFTVTVSDTLKPGDSVCLKIDINENWIEEFIKLEVDHSSIGILHKVETAYLDIKKKASFIIWAKLFYIKEKPWPSFGQLVSFATLCIQSGSVSLYFCPTTSIGSNI